LKKYHFSKFLEIPKSQDSALASLKWLKSWIQNTMTAITIPDTSSCDQESRLSTVDSQVRLTISDGDQRKYTAKILHKCSILETDFCFHSLLS